MKKEHESKKRLVILILAAAALCLAGGLCLYLAKIGKAAEPDRETMQESVGHAEVTVPEIEVPETRESPEGTEKPKETEQPQETENRKKRRPGKTELEGKNQKRRKAKNRRRLRVSRTIIRGAGTVNLLRQGRMRRHPQKRRNP